MSVLYITLSKCFVGHQPCLSGCLSLIQIQSFCWWPPDFSCGATGRMNFFPFTFSRVIDPNIMTHVRLLLQSWVWFNFLAAGSRISFSTLCSLHRRSLNTSPSLKLKGLGMFCHDAWCCVNLAPQLCQRGWKWQKLIRLKCTPRCYLRIETPMLSNNHSKATAVYGWSTLTLRSLLTSDSVERS